MSEISDGASVIFLGRVIERTVVNPGLDPYTFDVMKSIQGKERADPLTLDDFSTGKCDPDMFARVGNRVIVALDVPFMESTVDAYWEFHSDGSLRTWSTGDLYPTPNTLDGVLAALGVSPPDTERAAVARGEVAMSEAPILATILGLAAAVLVGRRRHLLRAGSTRRRH